MFALMSIAFSSDPNQMCFFFSVSLSRALWSRSLSLDARVHLEPLSMTLLSTLLALYLSVPSLLSLILDDIPISRPLR